MLDPNPLNILGKNVLPPEVEARLIARGCVFAMYESNPAQKSPILVTSKRPYVETATRFVRDAYAPVLAFA